jgi:hypothetical protein
MEVRTKEVELLTPSDMLKLVIDWTGGCPAEPGNSDVLKALMECGASKERLVMLAYALKHGAWSRYAAANLVLEMLSALHVRAAVALHGQRNHGLSPLQARRDVRELRNEAREIVQREVLMTVGKPKESRNVAAM